VERVYRRALIEFGGRELDLRINCEDGGFHWRSVAPVTE
jgi:hypothetical protein